MRTYYADEVTVAIGAILIEDGWADGEFLTIEMNEDAFNFVHSTDGMVTRGRNNNQSAVATVKLLQSSPSNAALAALYNLDLITANGAGIVPFLVKDGSGDSIYEAEECCIQRPPNVSFDRSPTSREWQIYIPKLRRLDAGN